MAHAITFDTLKYANKLKSVGFTEEQAEAQAETLAELVNEQLVTREYLDLRLRELELRLKNDLTVRLGGMLVAGIVIVATLVKLL